MLSNYLISSDEVFFTYSRDAIIKILTKIDPFKEKEIILPQYICSTVIDSIISWSDNITFYNVNDNFKFKDSEILKILNSKNNAILFLVDFFGVETQVSKKLMKEINDKKIILIRDAAHSFLTLYERRLNYSTTFNCDYIVTSIYKSIGTNVGALAVGIQGKNFINAYLFFKRFFINNLKFFLINFRLFNNNFLHRQRDMKIIDQSSLKKYPPINFYSIFRRFYLNIDYEELIKDKKNLSIIIFEKVAKFIGSKFLYKICAVIKKSDLFLYS